VGCGGWFFFCSKWVPVFETSRKKKESLEKKERVKINDIYWYMNMVTCNEKKKKKRIRQRDPFIYGTQFFLLWKILTNNR